MAILVLDEQFTGKRLILALEARGLDVKTVGDFGAEGRPDPDVVRRIADGCRDEWVLITMDTTILEDFAGFDWSRYAIAWVVIDDNLLGAAVEQAKSNVVHRQRAHDDRTEAGRPFHVLGPKALKAPAEPRKAARSEGSRLGGAPGASGARRPLRRPASPPGAGREPGAEERLAFEELAAHYRAAQLRRVDDRGQRHGEGPALREARGRLEAGGLLGAADLSRLDRRAEEDGRRAGAR